jgi:hypothetical protein
MFSILPHSIHARLPLPPVTSVAVMALPSVTRSPTFSSPLSTYNKFPFSWNTCITNRLRRWSLPACNIAAHVGTLTALLKDKYTKLQTRRQIMEANVYDRTMSHNHKLGRRLEAAGWGLFFIWVGIALLAHISWGLGLIGVGIITLGGQAVRNYSGLKLNGFSVVIGLLFFLGGIWELLNVQLDLTPIICVAAGVALLVSVFIGKSINHADGQNHTLPEMNKK